MNSLHVKSASNDANTLYVEATSDASIGAGVRLRHARGTLTMPVDVINGDYVGLVAGQAFSGGQFWSGGEILFTVDGGFVSGERPPSRMEFYTNFAGGPQIIRLQINSVGNLGINTTSQFGSGKKVIGIANAEVIPTTDTPDGGVLYVENGALKFRGSSGTVTTIAEA